VPTPEVGTTVAAALTHAGSEFMAQQIGPNASVVEGVVLSARPETLGLAVTNVEDYRGVLTPWKGEHVELPLTAVAQVQKRRFAVGRTVLLGAALVGGTVVAAAAISAGVSGGSASGSTGGTGAH